MEKWSVPMVLVGLLVWCGSAVSAVDTLDGVGPVEATMAYELLRLESSLDGVPEGSEELLRKVLEEATSAAVGVSRQPTTRQEALDAFLAIQKVMARHNFVQPPTEGDWVQTLGAALRPRDLSPEQIQTALDYNPPGRSGLVDTSRPLFYVDCDMGSLIYLSVAQRLGWEFRLMEVPRHFFVEWQLTPWESVIWDWTQGGPRERSDYLDRVSHIGDSRLTHFYLRSLDANEAKAYYLGLVATMSDDGVQAERLFEEALAVIPGNPTITNNFAFHYSTIPGLPQEKYETAVAYALAGWSMRPDSANFADTVACAFAARGDRDIAIAVEEWAIENETYEGRRQGFVKNRDRIAAGQFCE